MQLERLKWSVNHAYANVPHYSAAFDKAGVHPGDIKQLADIAKLPFTVKDDLRRNYPFGMFAMPREKVIRIHASSGTTGKPTVVGYSANDLAMWADVCARCMRAAGCGPACWCITPTATGCSPAASACITAPSGSAAPWCRCRAA